MNMMMMMMMMIVVAKTSYSNDDWSAATQNDRGENQCKTGYLWAAARSCEIT